MSATDNLHLVMVKNSNPERFQFVKTQPDDDYSVDAYGSMTEAQARAVMFAAGVEVSLIEATIRGARQRAQGRQVPTQPLPASPEAKSAET